MKTSAFNRKRLVIRAALVILLAALCFVLYYAGKEHEILLDNRGADIGGIRYEPLRYVRVFVGKNARPVTLSSGERGVMKVSGPRHTVRAELVDRGTGRVTSAVERSFNFGKAPLLMISIPALSKNAADVYLPLPGKGAQNPPPPPEPSAPHYSPGGGAEVPMPLN